MASRGFRISGSGTVSTRMSVFPFQQTAFMSYISRPRRGAVVGPAGTAVAEVDDLVEVLHDPWEVLQPAPEGVELGGRLVDRDGGLDGRRGHGVRRLLGDGPRHGPVAGRAAVDEGSAGHGG